MDKNKKIIHKENGRIDYSSSGAGSILSALRKYKVFDTWKAQGIKYINIVGTDNLNTRVCDPLALCFLQQSSFDCLADVVPNKGTSILYPAILKKSNGTYDQFFPFEIQQANFLRNMRLAQYLLPYLNIYCHVNQLKELCYHSHKKLFTYRIREKNDGNGYENYPRHVDGVNNIPEKFKFVQNVFNLMSLSMRNCLMMRHSNKMLMWDSKTVEQVGEQAAINNVIEKFIQKSKNHAKKFNKPLNNISDAKIFEGYISKFYNIKECQEFLFGTNEKHNMMDYNGSMMLNMQRESYSNLSEISMKKPSFKLRGNLKMGSLKESSNQNTQRHLLKSMEENKDESQKSNLIWQSKISNASFNTTNMNLDLVSKNNVNHFIKSVNRKNSQKRIKQIRSMKKISPLRMRFPDVNSLNNSKVPQQSSNSLIPNYSLIQSPNIMMLQNKPQSNQKNRERLSKFLKQNVNRSNRNVSNQTLNYNKGIYRNIISSKSMINSRDITLNNTLDLEKYISKTGNTRKRSSSQQLAYGFNSNNHSRKINANNKRTASKRHFTPSKRIKLLNSRSRGFQSFFHIPKQGLKKNEEKTDSRSTYNINETNLNQQRIEQYPQKTAKNEGANLSKIQSNYPPKNLSYKKQKAYFEKIYNKPLKEAFSKRGKQLSLHSKYSNVSYRTDPMIMKTNNISSQFKKSKPF